MRKKILKILAILGIAFGTLVPQLASSSTAQANFEGYKMHCVVDGNSNSDSKDSSDTADSSGGATGDWTQKGTASYKNAQEVWDFFKGKGLSGIAIAGIMGNAAQESRFDPKAFDGGSGHGIFQFTGDVYTGYTSWSGYDKSESVKNQLDYTWEAMQSAQTSHGAKNNKTLINGLMKASSTDEATQLWETQVEAAGKPAMQNRMDAAKQAYVLFGGANISGDSALLGAIEAAESGMQNADKQEQENSGCGSTSSSSGEAGNWAWPFKSIKDKPQISGEQLFGSSSSRQGGFHDGIDFGTVPYDNQDILAIHGGTVYKIDHQGSTQNDLGWFVCVKSDDGYYEVYQEFAFADGDRGAISVKEGDKVNTGDKIGTLSTKYGNVTHVHIGASKTEIMKAEAHAFKDDGTWIDWTKLVDKK